MAYPFPKVRTQRDGPLLALGAEHALIGCCIFDPTCVREAKNIQPGHFSEPLHGLIWTTIVDIVSSGDEPNLPALTRRFSENPDLRDGRYLADLVDKCGPPKLARQHAEEVQDAFTRRTAVGLINTAARDLNAADGRGAAAILSALRSDLERLEHHAMPVGRNLVGAAAAAEALMDALDQEANSGVGRGLKTGLRCFDGRVGGLRPGALDTIGGRPSMGKTSLMRSAAFGAAIRNPDKLFVIFSLEMSARELIERAVSAATFEAEGESIPYNEFARLPSSERERLRGLSGLLPANILIDDRSGISVDEIARTIWTLKARQPVGAVFIDYLQLMARPFQPGRSDALILGDITRQLKTLAREAELCIVLLSQLNRAVENREDRRPQLADLRDSGSIEQDSDAVLFPYREAYYLERAEPEEVGSAAHQKWQQKLEIKRRRMDVIAAKVRGGPTATDRQVSFAEFDHVADDVT
jgi:replicative DNA helicase